VEEIGTGEEWTKSVGLDIGGAVESKEENIRKGGEMKGRWGRREG